MNREETLGQLVSIRHHCFVRGIVDNESDFRMAFRDVNRAYVTLRDEKPGVAIRCGGRPRKYRTAAARRKANAEYQRTFRERQGVLVLA